MFQSDLEDVFDFLKDKVNRLSFEDTDSLNWRYEYEDEFELEYYHEYITEKLGCSKYDAGCSKLVLFFDEFPDIVIKIPFLGVRILDEDGDIVTHRSFCKDYCDCEVNIYYDSFYYDLQDIFAAEKFIGLYNGVLFYAQERCDQEYCGLREVTEDSKSKACKLSEKKKLGKYSELRDYLPVIIDQYGEEYADRLLDFIEEKDISDLHDGNIAFYHGVFKFIDYSSFESQRKGNKMGATYSEFVMDMIPWVADEYAIIKGEERIMFDHYYFVLARTINGAVFISENFGWEKAIKVFKEYKSMVDYFGGGCVTLYEANYEDCEIVMRDIVYQKKVLDK